MSEDGAEGRAGVVFNLLFGVGPRHNHDKHTGSAGYK